jgi:RNA polymerase sigma-70 factor (ECF subfamily)
VVLTRLDRLQDRERFPAWMFGVTRRILDRHRRRAWVRRWIPGFVPDVRSTAPGPDTGLDRRVVGATLLALLDKLPALQRECVVLADVEGRPLPEVAALLGVPLGTVKSRLRLARERLRGDPASRKLLPVLEGEGE